jgi:hypothetical protein
MNNTLPIKFPNLSYQIPFQIEISGVKELWFTVLAITKKIYKKSFLSAFMIVISAPVE